VAWDVPAEAAREMTQPSLASEWVSVLEPPPDLTVSEWAERHRMLPEASASRGGKWRNETAPYLAGIMDATLDHGVKKIALMKSAQSGGSESINNIIGYHVQHDPCPMLIVLPIHSAAEAWSKERLADMIRTTPALAAVVRDKAQPKTMAHQAESTLSLKMFPGGFIALGGAGSPNTFARWSVRIAIGDDVDRFPPVVGDEGDPSGLLVNRTISFYDGMTIFVSTPTLKGGRIETLFSTSDRRRYFVECPGCGRWDWISWSDPDHFRVGYDDQDPETARIECPSEDHGGCGAHMSEPERRQMVAGGEWRPTAKPQEPGLVGFHLPAMISTVGGVTLQSLVAKWLSARAGGKEALHGFVNTALAEGWEDRTASVQPHTLLGRRESYGDGVDVPGWAPCLTAGIDVQLDRFAVVVMAWGPAGERAAIDWREIPGDPKRAETQTALLAMLVGKYRHASGHLLPIHAACIDSGYATEEIYDFVLAHQHRTLFATKGVAGRSGEPIVSKASEKTYGRRSRPVRLYTINVDDAKAEILNALTIATQGPGYFHFPERVDEEFFSQLCSEHREPRYNKAKIATHSVWVQDRARNEALDCVVMALAAVRLLNPNIRQMAATITETPVPTGVISQPAAMPAALPQQQRRVGRSSYLGR